MKFSSYIAIGHLLGNKLAGGECDRLSHKVAMAFLARNEVFNQDGLARRFFVDERDEAPRVSSEAHSPQDEGDEWIEESEIAGKGAWNAFKMGLSGKKIRKRR